MNQVVRAVEESSITPVFAIGKQYEKMYEVSFNLTLLVAVVAFVCLFCLP